ncbi:aminoglycoside phosphotransferase family protein [Spongiactinospora sp. TRM90649]|uniref:phosphotransferase family protein n=1 Tax=Spongiactinospora sp. TRM90649 TaxID=3031114 RepID=UPI0023F84F8B|nr:aminoglycoside phosphotransferase family protein [Spongiactinospora sp. TRM90649]MDF5755265.1 aminoglycoside phosphotransferase family protein [Spongiactinospora sp. TRM90649]
MTISAGDGLLTAAGAALTRACTGAGLDPAGARLLRSFATTVYHLPAENAVVRLAEPAPGKYDRLVTSLRVTRWLAGQGYPATRPLDVRQPVAEEGFLVTFWHHEDDQGDRHDPAALGPMLRRLHDLPPVPFELPVYDPFGPVRAAIEVSRVLGDGDRDWLLDRCSALAETYYERLQFALPYGLIHGDAHRGNLIRASGRLLLCDWDSVSAGPREIDLVPTLQGARFGYTPAERAAFCRAYGYDVGRWEGYPVLRDMRELRTLTAVLRNAHRDPAAAEILSFRLASLRAGDDRQWRPF